MSTPPFLTQTHTNTHTLEHTTTQTGARAPAVDAAGRLDLLLITIYLRENVYGIAKGVARQTQK